MNKWSRAVVYTSLAVVILGFCLYFVFSYLLSGVSPSAVISGLNVAYLESTVLRNVFPMFFWAALGFIVAGVIVGLYLGINHMVEKVQMKSLGFFVGSALVIDFALNLSFSYLVISIPMLEGVGTHSQDYTLLGFFSGTCLLPLLGLILVALGVGTNLGSQLNRNVDETLAKNKEE